MTALGHELQRRGHGVTLIGTWDAHPFAEAAGLNFHLIGADEFPQGSSKQLFERLGQLEGWQAIRETIALLVRGNRVVLRDAPDVVRSVGIELLLVDQASPSGGAVADHLGLPFVTVCNALMLNQERAVPPFVTRWPYSPAWWAMLRNQLVYWLLEQIVKPLRLVVNEYRQRWGLPIITDPSQLDSPLAQISQQVESLEFPRRQLPPQFHFVGSFGSAISRETVPFPWEKLDGRPLVFASMGTLQNRLNHVFEAIAQACEPLDVQLVLTLGRPGAAVDALSLPGQPIAIDYAPQLDLLQKASLTFTHAGMNTVLESLSQGVPMVATPVTNDQPGIAARLRWAGAGEVVPLKHVRSDRLRQAIRQVLSNPRYRHNATKIQHEIWRAGGVTRAADIIEQAIRTGQPVLR